VTAATNSIDIRLHLWSSLRRQLISCFKCCKDSYSNADSYRR